MVCRRCVWLLAAAGVVIAAAVTAICLIAPPVGAQADKIEQLRRIITFFDDSRLDESEAAGLDALMAAAPPDERKKLRDALGRLVRDELLLEKTRTPGTGIPLLIVGPKGGGPHPAVLFMHGAGGAGLVGKETAIAHFALMADRGYLMVAFDARHFGERGGAAQVAMIGEKGIYPKIVIPTACEDVFEVVEYLGTREDVAQERVGMFGYSMGGLIALAAAAHDTEHVLKAVVCAAGGADFHTVRSVRKARGESVADLSPEVVAAIERFDPINHVDAFYPKAVLMIHGRNDRSAPVEGVQSFHRTVREHYAAEPERLELRLVDTGHELYPTWIDDIFDWFDRFLRGECQELSG